MKSREYAYLYNSASWVKGRRAFIFQNPLCVFCSKAGEVVDHIQPHKGSPDLFHDKANWQTLCKKCHDTTKKQIESKGYHNKCGPDGLPLDPNHPFNK